MEKDAIDNQMALERHQRKHIKTAKTEQLESAKDDLFNDLDEVNEMDKKLLKQKEIITSRENIHRLVISLHAIFHPVVQKKFVMKAAARVKAQPLLPWWPM